MIEAGVVESERVGVVEEPGPRWAWLASRRYRAFLVGALLAILAGQLLWVAHLYSANWDEAHHIYDGYNIWTRHDYRVNAEVPPLVKLAAALPLLPMRLYVPAQAADVQAKYAFLNGRAFVFGNGGDRVLLPARLMCVLFTLGLAWLIYAAGRRLFSSLAGLVALAMFAFDPNVLAHGSLVSTDVASALFLFATAYAFLLYVRMPTTGRLLLTGVLAGLAFVAKFTGVLVVPMLLLLAGAEGLRRREAQVAGRLLLACLGALLVAWVVLWGFYGFRYAAAPEGLALVPRLGPYFASMPNPAQGAKLAWVARWHLLPEAYLWGLANTKHTEWEYTSYFFGRLYRHGPWEYFPVAFLIKSTLPLLLLLVLTPVLWWRARARYTQELCFLLIPVAVYAAVVTSSHFDIGARHLMPIYPFLYVLAGATASFALRGGRVWTTVAGVLLAWQVVTSVRVAPAYMAYGNEAWGGPLAVRRYLSDSNVDWGQQLKSVKMYLAANHVTNCWFAYFPDGAVEPGDYGIDCHRLPTPSGLWWLDLPMQVPPVIDGTVLISESDLDGVESGDGPLNPYAAFQGVKPVAILQDGVYVYRGRFAVPLASAWVDVRESGQMAAAGDTAGALRLAQTAVGLAPESARTQLNLAGLLACHGAWPEALERYRAAAQWLGANRPALEEEELGPAIRRGLATAESHAEVRHDAPQPGRTPAPGPPL